MGSGCTVKKCVPNIELNNSEAGDDNQQREEIALAYRVIVNVKDWQ